MTDTGYLYEYFLTHSEETPTASQEEENEEES